MNPFIKKNIKSFLSLFLAVVMILSLTDGFTAKAAAALTVTLRIEQDESTLLTPVQVTLTDADKRDFGIGLSTETLTPLHALAKYLSEKKGATDQTMANYIKVSESDYGLFLNGISLNGNTEGSPAANSQSDVSWMYNVNNKATTAGLSSCQLKDKDSVVFYGVWNGGTWPDSVETYFSYFDQSSYSFCSRRPFTLTVSLKGIGWSAAQNLAGATVIATKCKGATDGITATQKNAVLTAKTDKNGAAVLTFPEEGWYVLSAYRKTKDGSHYDISRPYAVAHIVRRRYPCEGVNPPKRKAIAKPTKPSGLKAKVKKSKKRKKTIKLSWKRVNNITKYRIYISKKKNKNYTLLTSTRKTKITFKRKKGTYYVKIRAYRNSLYSKYSRILKIKVK